MQILVSIISKAFTSSQGKHRYWDSYFIEHGYYQGTLKIQGYSTGKGRIEQFKKKIDARKKTKTMNHDEYEYYHLSRRIKERNNRLTT